MALITSRTVSGRCPVCGEAHAVCGGPSTAVPIDEQVREAAVGPVQLYHVVVNGHRTRMRLNDVDAERLGGVPVCGEPEPIQPAAVQVAESAGDKASAKKPTAKKRTVRNKARTAPDKAAAEPAED